MEPFAQAVQALAGMAARPPPAATFLPLRPGEPGPVAAVDGSHAALVDNGQAWVVAHRAAAVAWPGPPPPVPVEVAAAPAGDAQAGVDEAYARHGLEPPRVGSAEAWAQARRALGEWTAALSALPALAGGTLLVDGALRGLPAGPQAMADRLGQEAQRHGVRLVGLAKRSGLAIDGSPSVARLLAHAPAGAWAVSVEEGTFVARLHPQAAHAFRVDAGGLEAVGRLLPLCRDAVYTGYPYPLALAHNAVAITAAHAAALRDGLALALRRSGGAAAARLLDDFHDVLDRNVPA